MSLDWKKLAAVGLITLGVSAVYWQTFERLVDAWIVDGNYSHGFLIAPIAAYFVWERRGRLEAAEIRPTWLGLVIFSGGIVVLLAGLLGLNFS